MNRARGACLLLGSAVALLLIALISISLGSSGIPLLEVAAALAGTGDETQRIIVAQLRLPRVLLSGLVGAGLALSGAVFQALLRNPLAEPYVLGVSSGAAVGAVTALVLGWTLVGPWVLPAAAFLGAALTIFLVTRIAIATARDLSARSLILAGVIVAAFFNAVILLLLSVAPNVESFRSAVFWMMGRFAGASWESVGIFSLFFFPTSLLLLAMARPLNLIALGEEPAAALGVHVRRLKWIAYLATSLLVAAAVSVSGVIGFVGLIVPHGVRLLGVVDHRLLLPACLAAGGGFLMLTDTIARTAFVPAEVPTGVVTAMVGVPIFVFIMVRSQL